MLKHGKKLIKPGDTQNKAHFPPKFTCSAIGELKVRLAVYKHRGKAVILLELSYNVTPNRCLQCVGHMIVSWEKGVTSRPQTMEF